MITRGNLGLQKSVFTKIITSCSSQINMSKTRLWPIPSFPPFKFDKPREKIAIACSQSKIKPK